MPLTDSQNGRETSRYDERDAFEGRLPPFCSAHVHSGAMLSQASLNVEPVPRDVELIVRCNRQGHIPCAVLLLDEQSEF